MCVHIDCGWTKLYWVVFLFNVHVSADRFSLSTSGPARLVKLNIIKKGALCERDGDRTL